MLSQTISQSTRLSCLSTSNLPVDDGVPVGVHRLAYLDGDLDLQVFTLLILHLLTGLLRVEIWNIHNLVVTVLVAGKKLKFVENWLRWPASSSPLLTSPENTPGRPQS